ncbi:MAG: hypothetical protein ACXWWV_11795 [Candidatus Deferrimicrobiaceae bacterium]
MKMRGWMVSGAAAAILSGCSGAGMFGTQPNPMESMMAQQNSGNNMVNSMMARQNFSQEMMKNPDLPAWHAQREKMALAIGDRVFDKGFDRVFDSMVTTLATLGCRVNNMERVSGYITASLPQLPPEQQEALRKEGLAQYAQAKGYPPSVLQKQGPYDMDFDFSGMMERGGGAGLTLSMVKQSARQTKVKLRFDGTYYPRQVEELYKKVWAEVDKQMFLDKALD